MYYRTKYPPALYIYSILIFSFSTFLILKNVPLAAVIFYDFFIALITLMVLRYSFIVSVYHDNIQIRFFNIFKKNLIIKLSEIKNIEVREEDKVLYQWWGNRKVRDRIIINLTDENSEVLLTENWKRYRELFNIIERTKK